MVDYVQRSTLYIFPWLDTGKHSFDEKGEEGEGVEKIRKKTQDVFLVGNAIECLKMKEW